MFFWSVHYESKFVEKYGFPLLYIAPDMTATAKLKFKLIHRVITATLNKLIPGR